MRLLTRVATGLYLVVFVVFCLAASPVILFSFGVRAVQHRIEDRWPDSDRARAVSFWFGLLAPVVLFGVLIVFLVLAIGQIRERVHARSL